MSISTQLKRLFESKAAQREEIRDRVEEIQNDHIKKLGGVFILISSIGIYLSHKCTKSVVVSGKVVPVTKGPIMGLLAASFLSFRGIQYTLEEMCMKEVLNSLEIDDEVLGILREENKEFIDEYRKYLFVG